MYIFTRWCVIWIVPFRSQPLIPVFCPPRAPPTESPEVRQVWFFPVPRLLHYLYIFGPFNSPATIMLFWWVIHLSQGVAFPFFDCLPRRRIAKIPGWIFHSIADLLPAPREKSALASRFVTFPAGPQPEINGEPVFAPVMRIRDEGTRRLLSVLARAWLHASRAS